MINCDLPSSSSSCSRGKKKKSNVAATSAHAVNSDAREREEDIIDPRKLQTKQYCPYLEIKAVPGLQLENVKVLLREFDDAPVVQTTKAKVSKTDILKPGDVLILLNDKCKSIFGKCCLFRDR
mmetsp:Transcript_26587/g.39995  ORF Transcript_26587/g.39995 Transcript_26587/m.39995 type:complete len:123 (-) Transcript_26587:2494-2862(-)